MDQPSKFGWVRTHLRVQANRRCRVRYSISNPELTLLLLEALWGRFQFGKVELKLGTVLFDETR